VATQHLPTHDASQVRELRRLPRQPINASCIIMETSVSIRRFAAGEPTDTGRRSAVSSLTQNFYNKLIRRHGRLKSYPTQLFKMGSVDKGLPLAEFEALSLEIFADGQTVVRKVTGR